MKTKLNRPPASKTDADENLARARRKRAGLVVKDWRKGIGKLKDTQVAREADALGSSGGVLNPARDAAMLVLDTNHLRELSYQSQSGVRLQHKLEEANAAVAITIVSAEELLKGRLARSAAARDVTDQIQAYERLAETIDFVSDYTILLWDEEAAARFANFRAQGVRIGTLDLRMACITLEYDATLLTRNGVDFAKVPGLR